MQIFNLLLSYAKQRIAHTLANVFSLALCAIVAIILIIFILSFASLAAFSHLVTIHSAAMAYLIIAAVHATLLILLVIVRRPLARTMQRCLLK